MESDSVHRQVTSAVDEGWNVGGSFFASIIAGTLLGYFADRWLGTAPWLVILGIALGSYSGFHQVWRYSKRMEDTTGRSSTILDEDVFE